MGCPADYARRCLHCDYVLEGLKDNQCPECGQSFDPHDPDTYASRIGERTLRWSVWTGRFILAWMLIVGVPAATAAVLAIVGWITGHYYIVTPGLFVAPESPLLWAIVRPVLVTMALPAIVMLMVTRIRYVRIRERRRSGMVQSKS